MRPLLSWKHVFGSRPSVALVCSSLAAASIACNSSGENTLNGAAEEAVLSRLDVLVNEHVEPSQGNSHQPECTAATHICDDVQPDRQAIAHFLLACLGLTVLCQGCWSTGEVLQRTCCPL